MEQEIKIKKILEWAQNSNLQFNLSEKFDPEHIIEGPSATHTSDRHNISFSVNSKLSDAGVLFTEGDSKSMLTVKTNNPKLDFVKCVSEFFIPDPCNIVMGKNVIVGKNSSLGGTGFGYVQDIDNTWIKFPHFGNIILEDNVEIGDNVCIDRGSLSDTIIRKGVKIDNLVHIAHNVEIGENSMIVANCMIAGSVKIGNNCWISPSSSISNGLTIGNNVLVGVGSNVIKNLPDNVIVAGNPAKILRENFEPIGSII